MAWHPAEANTCAFVTQFPEEVHYMTNERVFRVFVLNRLQARHWLVGLDLFNDNTCPSGHISHPTQVNVSQSCFNSLNKLLKLNYVVQVWGLVEVNCVISDRRIPLLAGIPSACLRNCLEEGIQWVSCVVLITTFLYHCALQEHMINAECLTTVVTSSGWSSGQDMDWIGFV